MIPWLKASSSTWSILSTKATCKPLLLWQVFRKPARFKLLSDRGTLHLSIPCCKARQTPYTIHSSCRAYYHSPTRIFTVWNEWSCKIAIGNASSFRNLTMHLCAVQWGRTATSLFWEDGRTVSIFICSSIEKSTDTFFQILYYKIGDLY